MCLGFLFWLGEWIWIGEWRVGGRRYGGLADWRIEESVDWRIDKSGSDLLCRGLRIVHKPFIFERKS